MNSGQLDGAQMRQKFVDAPKTGWFFGVAGPLSERSAELWQAEVLFGPIERPLEPTLWTYETCTFVSGPITTSDFETVCVSTEPSHLDLNGLRLTFGLQGSFNYRRMPNHALYDQFELAWPSTKYSTTLIAPVSGFQPPAEYLIGPSAPSFAAFASAYNAFIHDHYQYSGVGNPQLGELNLRVSDQRGRIAKVEIEPNRLRVFTEGTLASSMELELMATKDRGIVSVDALGETELALPSGLPDDAWLWLRTTSEWIDYLPMGGWGSRVPTVVDLRPVSPGVTVAALIARGESQHVEFKEQLPAGGEKDRVRTALKTAVAFANGSGGTLLYGVRDDGDVAGLPNADQRTIDQFNDLLRGNTDPMPQCVCSIEEVDGKGVLVIEVTGDTGKIHSLVVEANRPEYFVRRGATTFPARAEELQSSVKR